MPKTKILFFSHSSYLFGAENCLLSLATSLDRERFEPVAVLPADGALKQKLDEAGIRSHIIPMEWWVKNEGRFLHAQNELTQRVDQLLRVVAEENPDVIHSNTSVTWMGAFAARTLGIPHVWHLHEMLVGHPSLEPVLPLPLLYQSMDFLSDRIVTVSEELRRELNGYVKPEKVQIIHNGVQSRQVCEDAAAAVRAQIAGQGETILAVTVTSLQKYKGVDHLLTAAAGVVKQRADVVFAIAGTGPREAIAALTQQVKDLGLENNVRYLGFRDDVPALLAAADLFVLPSLKEAFPLVVLEAMSQGKAVVTTDCGGTAEMVTDGETGFLVPVADPAALAERILILAEDASRRVTMGDAGAKRFFEQFAEERYVARFAELYCNLAAAPKPALLPKEVSTLNALLTGYEGYIRAMRSLPEKENALQSVKNQSVELQALLADRDRKISELERRGTEQTRELQRKTDELEQREEVRVQQARELQQKTAELEERDAAIAALKTDLADLDGRLAQLEEELVSAGELRDMLEKRLDWKRAEIVSRDDRIKQIRFQIQQVGEQRVELERKLRQKTVELADRDERLRQVADEIAHEAKLIEEQLLRKDQELAEVTAAREAEKRSHEQERAHLSEELERLKQSSEQRLRDREQRIDDLLQSLSWKVTAPLRSMYDLVRGRR